MRSRYSSILIVAAAFLAGGPAVDRASPGTSRPGPERAGLASYSRPIVIPATAPTSSLRRLTPWRHRLKSVLEQKDARAFQPVVLGVVEIPALVVAPWLALRRPVHSLPLIPLRC